MDFKQLKQIASLPEAELTAKLVELAQEILRIHDSGHGLSPFDWRNLQLSSDGSLSLTDVAETELTDEIRLNNLHDYAGIVYCAATGQKSAESMAWDAGRKIKQPVLREIVLTICGRNSSIEPLVEKLREPYVDEDSFFNGYTTVDEKEATEAYAKKQKIEAENARAAAILRAAPSRSPWYKGIGVFVLIALCVGGYRAYQSHKKMEREAAMQYFYQQRAEREIERENIRRLSKEVYGPKLLKELTGADTVVTTVDE